MEVRVNIHTTKGTGDFIMKRNLSKLNTNQLRDLAVSLGADRKKLYGTSKQSIILTIWELEKKQDIA